MDAGSRGPEETARHGIAEGRSRAGPSAILRKAFGPLLAYHVLILGGAFLVGWGISVGSRAGLVIGLALIVLGIGVEVAVLVWSAGLTIRSARTQSWSRREGTTPGPTGIGPSLCTGCGWSGSVGRSICPRCGKVLIRGAKVAGGV